MRTARTSIALALLSALVTATSFVNQLVVAAAFGASRSLDGYLQATSLPTLAAGVFGGVFAYAMIPALSRSAQGKEQLARVSGAFQLTFLLVAAAVLVVGWVISPALLDLVWHGGAGVDRAQDLLVMRVAWCSTAMSIVVGFGTALSNVRNRFLLPVVLSMAPYLGGIAALLLWKSTLGVTSLALGLLAGTSVAAIVLAVSAREVMQLRQLNRDDFLPVRQFGRAAPVALFSVLAFSVYQSVDAYWAPQIGPSNLSVLGYCQRLLIALGAIIATGPSVILQPRLSAASAAGDEPAFQRELARGIKLTILVCAPAALWIAWLGAPIIRIAFERGAFARPVTLAVAGMLPYMLFGMVPMLCTVTLFKAFYARADLRGALIAGLTGPFVYFVLSGALLGYGIHGIGVAYATTWSIVALLGVLRLWPRWRPTPGFARFLRELAILGAVTVLMALVSARLVGDWRAERSGRVLLMLAASGALTAATYLLAAVYVARVDDLRALARAVRLPRLD